MGHPRPLFHLISVFFEQTIKFLQQINVKACPSSIWCQDSNLQPSYYESPPITTRPGLPPAAVYKLGLVVFGLRDNFPIRQKSKLFYKNKL